MSAPRWSRWLLARLAPHGRADEVVGDLEEAHRARLRRHGRFRSAFLTSVDTLEMAWALVRERGSTLRVSLLDFKLGLRMLFKHPGLTVLGCLSMAFAIFTGAGAFEFISQVVNPTLPLPEGDRLVAVRVWDAERSRTESRILYDLGIWREELDAIEELGAYRTLQRNLVTTDGRVEPVMVAAIDAAGFDIAGVQPLVGRGITAEDERPGAPAVAVIGHPVWRDRFAGDPDVVGATIRLDDTPTTVVGVMPEGFAFPVTHDLWVPFETRAATHAPGEGPSVTVFGRLAPDASLEDARTELEGVGERMASALPATHGSLRPRVMAYARGVLGLPASLSMLMGVVGLASNIPLVLFLVLICGNVALLIFARASSRDAELAVRSALGASRARLVLQLFVEALVLAAVAAVLGLAAAQYGLAWVLRITETVFLEGGKLPFWFRPSLSPTTLLYALLLTVLAALVAGVGPGLKVTRSLGSRLQRASSGGGGFRFGGVWTVVIVLQIAVTMIFPLISLATRSQRDLELAEELDFPADQYLSARLVLSAPAAPGAEGDATGPSEEERFAPVARRLEERLDGEPRVAGVTFAERLPRQYHPWRQIEVDGPSAEPMDERGHRLGSAVVAVDFFEVMGAEIVAGRGFRSSDEDGPGVVVVNESFVQRVLGERNPIGQRVRYLATEEYRDPEQEPGPWHEIVGVVRDFGTISGYGPQGMYHPAEVGDPRMARIAMHVSGDPRTFTGLLRSTAMGVDPGLALQDVITLNDVTRGQREFFAFWSTLAGVVSALAILLSLGGIFAVMSYTVSQRTREIGIRIALGSSRSSVVTAVFRRPLIQIALGLFTGSALLAVLLFGMTGMTVSVGSLARLVGYVGLMGIICLSACVVPTLRALSVEPGEALRADG